MFTRKETKSKKALDYQSLLAENFAELECSVSSDPSIWRALAFTSYASVRDELSRLEVHEPETNNPLRSKTRTTNRPGERQSIIYSSEKTLHEALQAMAPNNHKGWGGPRRWWLMLKLFYSGTRIEQAWTAIHRARAALYLLYPREEVPTQMQALQELVADLPESSTLRGSLTTALGQLRRDPLAAGMHVALRQIYEQAIEISDGLQREARILRNALMTASASIFAVALTLGVAHLIDTEIVNLCASVGKNSYCPLGSSAHPFDVFTVELAGMLGGLLSVVIPLATGERIKTPYRVFNQQLVLKTLAGAASALAGILLLEAGLIPELSVKSSAALLGYAVFFGFAQEVVTGAIDRRANMLAKETPSVKV